MLRLLNDDEQEFVQAILLGIASTFMVFIFFKQYIELYAVVIWCIFCFAIYRQIRIGPAEYTKIISFMFMGAIVGAGIFDRLMHG